MLNRLERKFGRYAIHNLMFYIIIIYASGAVLGMIAPNFYYTWLMLDFGMVLKGQVWRLVTFMLAPYDTSSFLGIIMLFIECYLYYYIGRTLENIWGAFRFNVYYIGGILLNILAAAILYAVARLPFYAGLSYLNRSLFLAICVCFPDMTFLLMFLIPIKAKWLGIFYGVMIGVEIVQDLMGFTAVGIASAAAMVVSLGNFLIFYFSTRNMRKISPKEVRRRADFRRQTGTITNFPRHRCEICGRTERDDPNLEFRFCSKCDGDHEYCMDHLYNHVHIKAHPEQDGTGAHPQQDGGDKPQQ